MPTAQSIQYKQLVRNSVSSGAKRSLRTILGLKQERDGLGRLIDPLVYNMFGFYIHIDFLNFSVVV